MPQGDGTAVDVDLGQVGTGLALPRQHDRGEGLVDLDQVDVGEGHAGLLQRVRRGRDGRGEHVDGVGAAHRQVMDAGPGLQVVGLQRRQRFHEF